MMSFSYLPKWSCSAWCPDSCLSIFSFVSTLLAVSSASLKLLMENKTPYNVLGSVFLNSSNISDSPQFNNTATCLILFTYASIVSAFSPQWNDLHTWNSCSCVLPNFEYCCLKCSGNPIQSTIIGLNDSYHNPVSLVRVKQNLCTFATSVKLCVSIQSFVLNKWASTSSSGLPENSGLKYDQFNCGCIWLGIWAGGAGGNIGLDMCVGWFCGCIGSSTWTGGACGCTGPGTWAGGLSGGTWFGTSSEDFVLALVVHVVWPLVLFATKGIAVEGWPLQPSQVYML